MLVLDTNHFSEIERNLAPGQRLMRRLHDVTTDSALTVVTVEEEMRGWLAKLHGERDPHRQIASYAKLQRQVEAFAEWTVLPWDAEAADLFVHHRRQHVRIGTLDLKIACVVLAHDATLLTRNTVDFAQVPGLRFENWLD